MADTILMRDVLKIMRTPNEEGRAIPFDISWRTLNRNSKTGGAFRSAQNAKLVMKEKGIDPNSVYALQHFKKKEKVNKKNPNHFSNKTRNIRLESGEIKKIHILHIIEFNGQKVTY